MVILGAGYTGRCLRDILIARAFSSISTRRSPGADILFDLLDTHTWNNLPSARGAIWTFPAEPSEIVRAFSDVLFDKAERVVVIGTTSSYRAREGEIITTETPLDETSARVQGEELLRKRGAIVLRSSGIYGPGRNPLDWLRRGQVRNLNRTINLIHVEDLSVCILAAMERGTPGSSFIVSDGSPRLWRDIAEWGIRSGYLHRMPDVQEGSGPSRMMDNSKLTEELHVELTHSDLFEEIRLLEQHSPLPT
jgi:nucleoside-diphosphate-sugar epimerase